MCRRARRMSPRASRLHRQARLRVLHPRVASWELSTRGRSMWAEELSWAHSSGAPLEQLQHQNWARAAGLEDAWCQLYQERGLALLQDSSTGFSRTSARSDGNDACPPSHPGVRHRADRGRSDRDDFRSCATKHRWLGHPCRHRDRSGHSRRHHPPLFGSSQRPIEGHARLESSPRSTVSAARQGPI